MKRRRKLTKGEGVLLFLTAMFLCFLMGLHQRDLKASAAPMAIETQRGGRQDVPPELPDPAPTEPLDMNTASAEELTELPGIGESLAARIIAYRETHGSFTCLEDLLNVSGIGEKKLAALEGLISIQ